VATKDEYLVVSYVEDLEIVDKVLHLNLEDGPLVEIYFILFNLVDRALFLNIASKNKDQSVIVKNSSSSSVLEVLHGFDRPPNVLS